MVAALVSSARERGTISTIPRSASAGSGSPRGLRRSSRVSGAPDLVDDAQLVQRFPKTSALRAELKIGHGAYMATTVQGSSGPGADRGIADRMPTVSSVPLLSWNASHGKPKMAILKEQRRTKAWRREGHLDIQRCGGAQVLRGPELNGLLATVCEELCSQPDLRLREPRCRLWLDR
jgi:hypothetical protein